METTTTLIAAILLFGFGLVNCFFGYRIFKTLLLLWGFLLGAGIGAAVASGAQPVVVLVVAVIAGVVGALIMRLLYYVGVFVVGASLGITIGGVFMALLNIQNTGGAGILIVLVAALIGGILAIVLQKMMLILATAFTGASFMVTGVLMLVPGAVVFTSSGGRIDNITVNPAYNLIALIATLVLGVIGVLAQYRSGKN